jgi:anhydro-N-acetylmuramic acid kinase
VTEPALYVGLISGTSMDAVDAALVALGEHVQPRMLDALAHPLPDGLHGRLAAVIAPGPVALTELGELDVALGHLFADACEALLDRARVRPDQVRAIGSHGQTVHHRPARRQSVDRSDGPLPFTLQLADPNVIAERTGITTVADFRRRDMAAGGQGAPLVPAFHRAVLAHPDQTRVVLNIGGIANITCLPAQREVCGFDTGPGNTLMDAWVSRHLDRPRDQDGAWAAGGQVRPGLLKRLLADPYFAAPAPKSTGREYFNLDWLDAVLADGPDLAPQDVQATLTELTALSVARAVTEHAPDCLTLLVCGGGVHNATLMGRLKVHLEDLRVESTAAHGIDPDWVEAMAFAWLAGETLAGRPGSLPAVTGARGARVLGGIYPA